MIKRLTLQLLILILITCPYTCAQTDSIASDSLRPLIPYGALKDALHGIKCTLTDLSFRTDYADPDSFRLPIVDTVMLDPLMMISFSDTLSNTLFEQGDDVFRNLAAFREYGFVQLQKLSTPKGRKETISLSSTRTELKPMVRFRENLGFLNKNTVGAFKELVDKSVQELALVRKIADKPFTDLPDAHRSFIMDTLPRLILEDEGLEDAPVEVLDSLQQVEDSLMERFVDMAEELILSQTYRENRAHSDMECYERMDSLARLLADSIPKLMDSIEFSFTTESELGRIAIGGYGDNSYRGEYILIVDLGGNDRYELNHCSKPQIILDLTGDDYYAAEDDFAIASGLFQPAILIDYTGDDSYNGYNFSLGSGLFSIGVLIDYQGDDFYVGDTHTQGAGTFGIGALFDYDGIDSYRCALFGQAFAGVHGLGVLTDGGGNDIYFAGGKYTDVLRYQDHYISLSQGFAYGWRPDMSGGVAILADSSGHDTYISDIFGQGSSYWYALGMQTDFAGNDKYISYQYAQGSAAHLCLGILMDKSGDDYYFAKGVSQGCGHDLAAGILIDYDGLDNYQAWDLSQGAGSANGFGCLIDYAGNDSYQIKGKHNTQGYGNPRRDYGSIGLFLDLMGQDEYIGNGSDNAYWIINSRWGIGVDRDYWPKPDSLKDER